MRSYCSEQCKWTIRKTRHGIPCAVCGEPTGQRRSSGLTEVIHKACGLQACGTVAAYRRGCRCSECRAALADTQREYQRGKPGRGALLSCIECGTEFRRRVSNQLVCSGACRKARHGKFGHPKSRADFWGVEYQRVKRATIFERDGWQCGICTLPIDPAAKFPDMGAATLDHVVPMSLGGPHLPDNLQAAHFYCNTVKGARTEGAA